MEAGDLRIGSDQNFMAGICWLESWVTVPAPTADQKLELDPCGQMGGGQGSLSLSLAWSQPGLVRSEGHILMSKCPVIYWPVAQPRRGQMPTSQLTYIGVLVGEVPREAHLASVLVKGQAAPLGHCPLSPIQSVNQ